MPRRWSKHSGDPEAFLLLCPNLTVVALGAAAMIEARKVSNENASWLLLTGFFMTMAAVALLPANLAPRSVSPSDPQSRIS